MNSDRLAPIATSLGSPNGEARERVVQALCIHFASDHLSMTELEDRLERAYAARSAGELEALVANLPVLSRDKVDQGLAPILAPSSVVPPRGVLMAVMGGNGRRGGWLVPRHLKIVAVMGGAELDMREARFSPGVTEIDVFVLMGGVEISVPPGVRVEIVGSALMGGFEADAGDASALDSSQPILRISGLVIMGGVEAKVRKPGKKMLKKFQAAWEATRALPSGRDQ
ncbi:MAG: DUF1707 and DUF2154 domain-containing protein [Anaerolineae bacterium]|nr:DUF1707 and DUF2154 domain-containing protein [Gemmatimonadaceae bacterium]